MSSWTSMSQWQRQMHKAVLVIQHVLEACQPWTSGLMHNWVWVLVIFWCMLIPSYCLSTPLMRPRDKKCRWDDWLIGCDGQEAARQATKPKADLQIKHSQRSLSFLILDVLGFIQHHSPPHHSATAPFSIIWTLNVFSSHDRNPSDIHYNWKQLQTHHCNHFGSKSSRLCTSSIWFNKVAAMPCTEWYHVLTWCQLGTATISAMLMLARRFTNVIQLMADFPHHQSHACWCQLEHCIPHSSCMLADVWHGLRQQQPKVQFNYTASKHSLP